MIDVYNTKYETEKETLAKFGNNVKDLLDDMSKNYSIIIDKGECHEDHGCNIFMDILSGPN